MLAANRPRRQAQRNSDKENLEKSKDEIEHMKDSEDELLTSSDAEQETTDEDSEEEFSPERRRPSRSRRAPPKTSSPTVAAAARRQKSAKAAATKAEAPPSDSTIYDVVMEHGAAIEATVTDWLDGYCENHVEYVTNLMNFLLQASGCPEGINKDDVEQGHERNAEVLTELHQRYIDSITMDYPIATNKKQFKKFRKNFVDFWARWLRHVQFVFLFESAQTDDDYVHSFLTDEVDGELTFEFIKSFIASMSISPFRPFRHTATLTVLTWITTMAGIGRQLSDQVSSLSRQISSCQKHTTQHKDLVKRHDELHKRKTELLAHIQDLTGTVFVHRYRDVDESIRRDCMLELATWLEKFPEVFLETNYLKYVGWVLSDKDATVRLAAVKTFEVAVTHSQYNPSVRSFTDRFKGRIIEMATMDVDENVQREVIETLLLPLIQQEVIEETDLQLLAPLLACNRAKKSAMPVRFLAAKVLLQSFYDLILEPELEKCRGDDQDVVIYGTFSKWIEDSVNSAYKASIDAEARLLADEEAGEFKGMTEDEKLVAVRQLTTVVVDSVIAAFEHSDSSESYHSLLKPLTDIDGWLQYLMNDDFTGMQESFNLVLFTAVVRSHLGVKYNMHDQIGSLFEEHRTASKVPSDKGHTSKVKKLKSKAKDDLESKPVVQKLSLKLEALIRRYSLNSNDSGFPDDLQVAWSTAKTVSLVELCLWTLAGFVYEDSHADLQMVDASGIWSELRATAQYDMCLNLLVDEVFMKHKHPTVIKALGRLLFGSWKMQIVDDEVIELSLSSSGSSQLHVASKVISTTEANLIAWLSKTADSLQNGASGLGEDDLVALVNNLYRLESLLRNRGLPKKEEAFSACFQQLKKILIAVIDASENESGVFGLELKGFFQCEKDPGLVDVDSLCSDVKAISVDTESDNPSDNYLYELHADAIHSTVACMFHTLIWYCHMASSNNENWFKLLQEFFAIVGDLLLTATGHVNYILQNAQEIMLENRRGDSQLSWSSSDDQLTEEEVLTMQKLSEKKFFANHFLSHTISGFMKHSTHDSLPCLVGDLLSLVSKSRGNETASVEVVQTALSLFLSAVTEKIFPNMLASCGHKNVLNSAAHAVKNSSEPSTMEPINDMKQFLNEILTAPHFYDPSLTVLKRTHLTPFLRKIVWPLVQKWFTTFVRSTWLALTWKGMNSPSVIFQLGTIISWNGKWNQWVDELAKCVIEEWRNLIISQPMNASLKLSCKNTLLLAVRKSLACSLLTRMAVESEEEMPEYEPVFHLTHQIATSFRSRIGKPGSPVKTISELFSVWILAILREVCLTRLEPSKIRAQVDLTAKQLSSTTDAFLGHVMHLLNSLLAVQGSFGHDILTGTDAHAVYDQVKRLVEDTHEAQINDLIGGVEQIEATWDMEYQKLLRSLVGIAKRGGAPVPDFFMKPALKIHSNKKGISSPAAENSVSRFDSLAGSSDAHPQTRRPKTRKLSEIENDLDSDEDDSSEQLDFQMSPQVKRVRRQYF